MILGMHTLQSIPLRAYCHPRSYPQGLSNTVPVVTLPSDLIQGRFALAIYRQMGYSDLVAADLKVWWIT